MLTNDSTPSVRLKREPEWRKTFRSILEPKQTVGIARFTETHDNETMWAHFAGNYQGGCIAYAATKLRDNLPKPAELARMAYADVPVRLSKHDKTNIHAAAHKILSHKKYNWAYGREWRDGGTPGRVTYEETSQQTYISRRGASHRSHGVTLEGRGIRFHQMKVTGYRHKWMRI
jgi:Protein of unknown function (DUF2971)